MKKKKVLSLVLVGAMVLSIAGCSKSEENKETENIVKESTENSTGESAEESPENKTGESTEENTEENTEDNKADNTEKDKEIHFTDDLGREITITKCDRVAVLNASYAEAWALAGGSDTIVSASDNTWTDADIELSEDVINLGKVNEISLELLLESEPDFVIASADISQNVDDLEMYEKAGLNVAYFGVTDYEDYLRMLKTCTMITGREDCYEANGTSLQNQVDAAFAKVKGKAPKVLYVRATTSGVKAKNSEGSVLGKMLSDLGCINIADVKDSLMEDISMEVIMEEDPDFIFAIYMGKDTEAIEEQMKQALYSNGAWSTLTAVQNDRFMIMDNALYNLRPNARWGEAYEKLAEILYQE